ncbi:MAG: von Willebrand factor type [Planctomycetota bacterium]|nr:MAG: von Willebrand factor type [Planctomycetota bacterium]
MTREEMRDKLTDYAVGELTPAERAEIERALEADAELRAELDAIRETVALVSACPAPSFAVKEERLSTERVDAILSRIVTAPRASAVRRWWWVGPISVAAAGLFAVSMHFGMFGPTKRERELESKIDSLEMLNRTNGNIPGRLVYAPVIGPREGDLIAGGIPPGSSDYTGGSWASATDEKRREAAVLAVMSETPRSRKALEELRKLQSHVIAGKEVRDVAKGGSFRQFVAGQGPAVGGEACWGPDPFSNTEEYNPLVDNPFNRPFDAPLSTFSIDVDTASYANVRRFLTGGQLPPPDSVRLEELVNYFHYAYVPPAGVEPFSVALEAHAAPWEPKHQLVRIGLQGKVIELSEAPAANLAFLVDVSGSMNSVEKLPLVQSSLGLLVETLRPQDRVSMVVYAGNAGLVLPPTSGAQKQEISAAIGKLQAGGSTNGGQGIELAYKLAADNFIKDGVNRVILCTDGDFNVGVTSEGDLDRLIEEKRKTGVFLSVLGFGRGNYADARMQSLADKGNGNASYIDTLKEAQKVLVEQATGTLITIAKDVKIQVEFNPAKVAAYRLIGYENRLLAAQDFNDDKKDAGEIGAGHQVTALYEVIPAGQEVPASDVDALKYQETAKVIVQGAAAAELCTVKLRYKAPDGDVSRKIEFALADPGLNAAGASTDFEFAASVAAFAMCLRDSEYKGQANFGLVRELAVAGLGDDAKGYRKEFVELVKKAGELAEAKKKAVEEKK